MPLNLVTDPWMEVRRLSGARDRVRVADLCAAGPDGDAVEAFAWGRADLDIASLELVIGLLAVAFAPRERADRRALLALSDPDAVQARLVPLAPAFALDGPAPRCFQDAADLDGDILPVTDLFIDATADFFGKPERFGDAPVLSRPAAAITLFALQAFAPSGGRGHRTSLRGGGPMTTLVAPKPGARPLWEMIAANVPALRAEEEPLADPGHAPALFPWLAPTLTSEAKGAPQISAADTRVHPLHSFFGMPRRIVLCFAENAARRPCAVTGRVDDVVATGFRMRHGGMNYGAWVHPLTPYRVDKKSGRLPLHPREGRMAYPDWLGVTLAGPGGDLEPARVVTQPPVLEGEGRLLVAGYAMDNAKVLDFVVETVPLLRFDDDDRLDATRRIAWQMVAAAGFAAAALRRAVAVALYPLSHRTFRDKGLKGAEVPRKALELDGLRDRLFAATERDFETRLRRVAVTGSTLESPPPDVDARAEVEARDWIKVLRREALSVFDACVSLDTLSGADEAAVTAIVGARRALLGAVGPAGLFACFGLAQVRPEGAKAGGAKAGGRRKAPSGAGVTP